MPDVGIDTYAGESVSISNHNSPDPDPAITFDTTSYTSPEAEDDEQDPVRHLAHELTEQLAKFRGCCNDCHQEADCERSDDPNEHISLAMYLEFAPELGPDILGSATIAHQKDDLAGKLDAATRREMFCGIGSRDEIPRICLREDDGVTDDAGVSFDVDSIIAFPSCLAVAKQGIRWSPTQMTVSDLQSDLHLRSRPVTYLDATGIQHQVHRPVHQIPHYTFGRVVGLEDISLYFLFPNLYREEQKCSRLRDEDFQLWTDGILFPAIYKCYSSAHVQHYPSSYDHSRYNSTARGVETLAQRVHPVAREQQLVYFLPPEALAEVWANILATVQEPGFQQFQDVTILLQAKNLKVLTKDVTWEKMVSRFKEYWVKAIDENHITPDFYLDIGKETCPRQASQVVPWSQLAAEAMDDLRDKRAESLIYRRCCLESYAFQAQHGSADEASQKQAFYPFSMLQDTGSLTIETGKRSSRRLAGLLYSQFYPSVKEVFAAGNVYPFTNTAIETLALDKKLRKTWELVGGGLSHQPAALIKAYLYTKLRCHYALLGSMQKSFGIREEHRVSKELFYAIDSRMRSRELHNMRLVVPTNDSSPYYSFTTDTLLRWLRWNINKFCVGFEMVYSFQDPHFVTWEHTRIMLMFLRCLQFSYSGGLIQKVGGCWQDIRQRPDPSQPNGLRRYEGLGFKRTMEVYGYAWFLDKIDWNTLTFRQPHAAYMMFNNPSMQTVYRARYHQVRDVRIDFIRVDKAYQWMLEFSAIPMCLDLLENYLRELCLCAFRKDVFFHVKSALKPECMEAALAGDIPLCYDSVNNAMLKDYQPLQLAQGNRLAVKDVHVLFAWLWKSKDDHFERQGWNEKPYRMLFQQSFHAIRTARGKSGARRWRQELKRSFLGSHWILPYPHSRGFMRKEKEEKQFTWWPSLHQGLIRHYAKSRQTGTLAHPLPASNIENHPIDGWQLAGSRFSRSYMPYVIQPEQELIRMPENELYAQLVALREQVSAGLPQSPSIIPTLELDTSPESPFFPKKWCQIRQMEVAKTFEECDEVNDCIWFLKKGLESYEHLQHRQQNRRKRRQNRTTIQPDSDLSSISGSDEAEATSDEEGLVVMRKKQAQVVRNMETRVHELIEEFKRRYPQWKKSYDPILRKLNRRLERVE
ncbi:hypothetical protein BGZ61DRAFT_435165 [Ilyonectria robusta]|uniref:uncharacterized protein n=1 Tax=Ilyonectria robusta TaxID=1079257 RepID=UPI001E8E431F|nr:uncharacterized protein BGZ61DRAFT_435165 [Ilyonectria robusta]KAH8654320.1 hypothetical protein BGZ61DRAFT_435165 [Ilyonectria robusta]